jgi:hypothetical protein
MNIAICFTKGGPMRRVLFVAVIVLSVFLLAGCDGGSSATNAFSLAPESALPAALRSTPPRVREAYQFAINNQEELAKYPCYCGCGPIGHTSNLSCYIQDTVSSEGGIVFDMHSAGCGICVDITHDVMRLLNEGQDSPAIRTYIDARYSVFGPATDTPFPSE